MCFGCYIQIKELWPFASCKMWKCILSVINDNLQYIQCQQQHQQWQHQTAEEKRREKKMNSKQLVNCNNQFIIFHSIECRIAFYTQKIWFSFYFLSLSVIILSFFPLSHTHFTFSFFTVRMLLFNAIFNAMGQYAIDTVSQTKNWTATIGWDLLMNRIELNLKNENDK